MAENQKIENILNLALDATEEERKKSENLDVGYYEEENEWDVIILYLGSLEKIRELSEFVTPLLGNFAVVRIRESMLERLAALEEVIYIEKPKRLFLKW